MTNASFDTYSATKALCEAGFNEIQAVATVSMVRDAMVENVASKTDISELKFEMKSDMSEFKTEMKDEMSDLRSEMSAFKAEMKGEMSAFKSEVKDEMTAFKTEIKGEMTVFKTELKDLENRLNVRLYTVALGAVVANTSLIVGLNKLLP